MHYTVLLFIRAPFLCIVSFRCYVFCVLVVLVKLSVLAKWLARKTSLRKPNRGEGIISRKPRPKNAHDFLGLLYCFIVLLCTGTCVVSCPYVTYFPTVMVSYSLFVLKVPLNPKQTNKQTNNGMAPSYLANDLQCVTDLDRLSASPAFVVDVRTGRPLDTSLRVGSGVVGMDPLRFLAGCPTRRLNQV